MQIEGMVLRYFNEIFTTSNPTNMGEVLKGLEQRILDDKRNQLDKEFTEIEIKEALHQMNPNKALV